MHVSHLSFGLRFLKKELETFKSLLREGNLNPLFLGGFKSPYPKGSIYIYIFRKKNDS